MADRGRDLKVSILSDADRFDLDKPAQDLEKLGEEALDAKRELDKLYDAASAGDLDKLGDEAKSTATKVDSAFEKIAASSKSNLRKVDDDVDRAKRGMDDMKSEAGQSGREAAASFGGGFEDIGDFIQETAANAFGGFGALGAAAGIAAAAGIGLITKSITEAKEKFDELRKSFTTGLIEGGGELKGQVIFDKLKEMAEDGTLDTFKRQAESAGIAWKDYVLALAGDQDAIDRTRDALGKFDTTMGNLDPTYRAQLIHAQDMHAELNRVEGAYGLADEAAEHYRAATDEAREAAELATAAEEMHREALAGVEQGIRDVGDASGEVAEAVAEDGQVTIGALTEALQEATEAAKDHAVNVQTALKEGGAEFAQWVSEQGAEVSQAYANGSAKERAALREAFENNVGAAMGSGISAGLQRTKGAVADAAGNVYTAVENTMTGETILIPTKVGQPNNTGTVLRDVQNNMQPVVIPVMLQNVPQSIWSRYQP